MFRLKNALCRSRLLNTQVCCVTSISLLLQVVKDYKRTQTGQQYDPSKYVVSPITGELVPLAEMQEHMRINLIDPKWKDQRESMLAKIKETTKANDVEIMSNLTRLAGTRPDIFGSSSDEISAAIQQETLPKDGPMAPARPDRMKPPPLQLGPAPVGAAAPAGRGTIQTLRVCTSEVFFKAKLIYFLDTLSLQMCFLTVEIIDFRGDLCDISADMASPVCTLSVCVLFSHQGIPSPRLSVWELITVFAASFTAGSHCSGLNQFVSESFHRE